MINLINTANSTNMVLPLTVNFFSYKHDQEVIKRPNGIGYFQLLFCHSGQGEITIKDQTYNINQNDAVLIFPNVPHWHNSLTKKWELDILGFSGSAAEKVFDDLLIDESSVFHVEEVNPFFQLFEKMDFRYVHNEINLLDFSVYCYEMLLLLANSSELLPSSSLQKNSSIVNKIIVFLENNYPQPINLDDLSKECNLSKEYLCSLFKKETGQSIMKFLTSIRISKARIELLRSPEKTVFLISREVGFQDSSYFCKVFKKIEGVTPDYFRKKKI